MIQFPKISTLWKPEINVDQLLRTQGADPLVIAARHPEVVKTYRLAIERGLDLLAPKVIGTIFPVLVDSEGCLVGDERLPFSGPLVRHILSQAEFVAVAVCTVGSALEDQVSISLSEDPAFALALDSFGSIAVDTLGETICQAVTEEVKRNQLKITAPISPGLNGWEISQGQKQIFKLLDTQLIGVSINPSFQMLPRKSVSLVLGIGSRVQEGGSSCDYCSMKETCFHRCFRYQPEMIA
jgi:hypothetical protein